MQFNDFSTFMELCNYHHNIILKQLHHPKRNPVPLCSHSLFPLQPVAITNQLYAATDLPFPTCHRNGIMQHVFFILWLLSFGITCGGSSIFQHVSVLGFHCQIIFRCIDVPPLVHPVISGQTFIWVVAMLNLL